MPRIETITLAAIACALAGCASDPQLSDAVGEFRAIQTEVGIAPDAARPDPTYEAFLGRLDKNCNQTPVGQFSIRYVLLQQAPFLDLTSRFFNGIISEQSYVDTLSGWYFTSSDSPGIRCILRQLPPPASPPPLSVPPVIKQ